MPGPGTAKPKGAPAVSHYMTRGTQVFVKEDGEWKVRSSHYSPISTQEPKAVGLIFLVAPHLATKRLAFSRLLVMLRCLLFTDAAPAVRYNSKLESKEKQIRKTCHSSWVASSP